MPPKFLSVGDIYWDLNRGRYHVGSPDSRIGARVGTKIEVALSYLLDNLHDGAFYDYSDIQEVTGSRDTSSLVRTLERQLESSKEFGVKRVYGSGLVLLKTGKNELII